MSSRIILGTAQFGIPYGISNKKGKIPKKEIFKILDYAFRKNIRYLDTASGYGKSEQIIGDFSNGILGSRQSCVPAQR